MSRNRRRSSKKKLQEGEEGPKKDYHRGMSKEVIAQYLADMENDDFVFVPPTAEQAKGEEEKQESPHKAGKARS